MIANRARLVLVLAGLVLFAGSAEAACFKLTRGAETVIKRATTAADRALAKRAGERDGLCVEYVPDGTPGAISADQAAELLPTLKERAKAERAKLAAERLAARPGNAKERRQARAGRAEVRKPVRAARHRGGLPTPRARPPEAPVQVVPEEPLSAPLPALLAPPPADREDLHHGPAASAPADPEPPAAVAPPPIVTAPESVGARVRRWLRDHY